MDFGKALLHLKEGYRVTRLGWNGKDMWLSLVQADLVGAGLLLPGTTGYQLLPWIGLKTADGKFVPWQPLQTDMLASDWALYMIQPKPYIEPQPELYVLHVEIDRLLGDVIDHISFITAGGDLNVRDIDELRDQLRHLRRHGLPQNIDTCYLCWDGDPKGKPGTRHKDQQGLTP